MDRHPVGVTRPLASVGFLTLTHAVNPRSSLHSGSDENAKVLRDRIEEGLVPILQKQEEPRKRKAQARELELLNLQKMATAKRSSRLAGKAEQQKQEQQAEELAELRARSAVVVEKWYSEGVLKMGERWADWEERLREGEILIRRREAAKKREEGLV